MRFFRVTEPIRKGENKRGNGEGAGGVTGTPIARERLDVLTLRDDSSSLGAGMACFRLITKDFYAGSG